MEDKKNKVIHLCEAACGSGKTEMLVSNIDEILKKANVLISVPTIELCDSIRSRIKAIKPRVSVSILNSKTIIDSGVPTHITVQNKISSLPEKAFDPNKVIIITNQTLSKIDADLLGNWIVIIDEVPNLIDFRAFTFKPFEARLIEEFIKIKDGKVRSLDLNNDQLNELTSRTDDGVLSESAKHLLILIKQSLSTNEPVFYFVNSNDNHCYHSIQFKKAMLDIFSNSLESHILCANIKDSMSDLVLKHHGFYYEKSYLTPTANKHKNTNLITIYPLLKEDKAFSRTLANKKDTNDNFVLNLLLGNVKKILKQDFIYVVNKWAIDNHKFHSLESEELNIKRINYDQRGNNDFRLISKVAFVASARPNLLQSKNIDRLSEITGFTRKSCLLAWNISNAYEMAYQTAARTCLRIKDNTEEVKIVVPDYRFVEYIKEQFLNAKVSKKFIANFDTPDDRANSDEEEKFIKKLISKGYKYSEVNEKRNLSSKTFTKYRKELILVDIGKGYSNSLIKEKYNGVQLNLINKLRSELL